MTVSIKDAGLRRAFEGMLNDNRLTKAEVQTLIDSTADGAGLAKTEKADLKRILDKVGDTFDADAKALISDFLGLDGSTVGEVTIRVSDRVTTVAKLDDLASTFAAEIGARASEFTSPEDAFKLFAEYGGRLKALAKDASDPRDVDTAAEALLAAGRNSAAAGFDQKDLDHDTISDLAEAARGRDPAAFDKRDEEVGKVWTTTYWPMAGSGDNDQEGSAGSNLWAKKGPLAKLDQLLGARGMDAQAKALEFERKAALGWLVGDRDTGHMINNSSLKESDAEMSTGVDFDGDGKITSGVKVDFLANDQFASVRSRSALVPKATIDGDVVEVRRERVTDDAGAISFKFFRQDSGAELTAAELNTMFYANPVSGDGDTSDTMSVGWWGSCDKVALAGILFKEPIKDSVTIDGVTFTKQDMLGLLTVIADSQASGTDFIGNRYDKNPDILVKKDGTQLNGKFVGLDDETFRGGEGMWRTQGDVMVLTDPFKGDPDKEVVFKALDGTEHKLKAKDIKHVAREDKKDMDAAAFHTTMLSWLSDGRAAAMDRDSGDHVWNYNFHGATLKSANELTGDARPDNAGHNGPVADDTTVVAYEMDVRFGESDWPREYSYWLEMDKTGKVINSGWTSDNPDFLWRPSDFKNFTGANPRNPFVKPELVKEIYDAFMAQDG